MFFYLIVGVLLIFAVLYNRRYNQRLRGILDAWAAREGLSLERVKVLVVWRGIGQKYDKGDGVYELRARRGDGAYEQLRVCLPQGELKRGADAVIVESREEISHLHAR